MPGRFSGPSGPPTVEQIRQAAERIELALNAGAIVGTWVWDVPDDFFTADHRFARSFHLDPEKCRTGLALGEVMASIHADDHQRVNAAIAEVLARGGSYRCDYRVVQADGSYRWIEANGLVEMAEDGTAKRFPGVLIDVHDRKVAEAERDRAVDLLRTFMEAVPGVIYAKDLEGRFLVANRGTSKLVGKGFDDFIGRTDGDVLDNKEQAAAVMTTDRRVMTSGEPETVEEEVSFPDGTEAVWLSTKAPLRNEAGEIVGLVGSSMDITRRKELEAHRDALIALGDSIRDIEDPVQLAYRAAELLGRTLRVSRAGYGTIDTAAETITIERDWNAPGIRSLAGVLHFRDYGSYIEDLKRGETVVFGNAFEDPRTAANAEALKAISAQAVVNMPVTEQGGFVALLYLNHENARAWSEEELSFIREVADRTRTAVERRRAEQELRDLAASLERLVDERTAERDRVWRNSRDLLAVVGADGVFREANPAWSQILGYAPAEVEGRSFHDFVWPDDAELTQQGLAAAAQAGELSDFVNRYTHKDGTPRWISWHTSTEGDLVYAYGRDITKTKEADEALERSEARLRAIFETTLQYQGLLTVDGTLLAANATSLGGIGVPLEAVLGRPFWDTLWFNATPGMPEAVREAVLAAARGETVVREMLVNLPAGQRSFEFAIRPMRDAAGEIVALVPEAIDITDRRLAEDALRQSQKLEAMGQLTGGVAHDFNNLLTPIIGSLDLLHRNGLGGPREKRLIDGALQSAERAKTLVQRLLAFARRQPLQPTAVDLERLVTGMADLVASTSGPQVEVIVDIADELPPAEADANQLELAILNLSVNARDAMPGGGKLIISAREERVEADNRMKLPPGAYIRLAVADTGTGMDEATIERAIEPFFSTKGVGKGTGLGLSMVHGLASQLGGGLTLESKLGEGTSVALWLPVSAKSAEEERQRTQGRRSGSASGTVLLVDDEELVRMSTADMLADLGYSVTEASSAEEALAMLDDGLEVDVLLTDHLMVGMTGADLARIARKRSPSIWVLLVSGYAEAEGVAPDLPRLTKPFRQADLAASLASLKGVYSA